MTLNASKSIPEIEGTNATLPEELRGADNLEVYKEIVGPTAYVPGPGADYIPSAVGNGGIGTHALARGAESKLLSLPVIDKVLFRLEGLSDAGIVAARKAIGALREQQAEVTHEAVLKALQAHETRTS
ncbi:MAG: hypothetical protein EPN89_02000 [Methylovulum sp.]|nr:MAG: hypothetical protein EPN89_02000 [Methylovulum sp.]